jgi:hypothetical protein
MAKSFSTADIKARLSEMIGKVVYGQERLLLCCVVVSLWPRS